MIKYEDGCVGCPSEMGCMGSACPYMNMPVAVCDACECEDEDFYELDGEFLCRDCYIKAMLASAETKNGGECCGCIEDADTLYELDGDWLCRKCFIEAIFEIDNHITSEQLVKEVC